MDDLIIRHATDRMFECTIGEGISGNMYQKLLHSCTCVMWDDFRLHHERFFVRFRCVRDDRSTV